MESFDITTNKYIPTPTMYKDFFDDIVAVYEKHGLAIEHEDSNGAFIIQKLNSEAVRWLRNACIKTLPFPGIEQGAPAASTVGKRQGTFPNCGLPIILTHTCAYLRARVGDDYVTVSRIAVGLFNINTLYTKNGAELVVNIPASSIEDAFRHALTLITILPA